MRTGLGIRRWLTARVADFLQRPTGSYEQRGFNDFGRLKEIVRKGDILLVEGDQRVSAVIKFLTQSSWSHAALYVGDELVKRGGQLGEGALEAFGDEAHHLVVEALFDGVVASPLTKYVDYNVRLTRPHRLRPDHLDVILNEAVAAIGWRYDLRNILDLALHIAMASLVPGRYKRRVLRLGSQTSTEVICTSLLGRLFHKVRFPVLPSVTFPEGAEPTLEPPRRSLRSLISRERQPYPGVFRRRHPTLLTPRDFDLSPYFEIVKFNLIEKRDFDYQRIEWEDDPAEDEVA